MAAGPVYFGSWKRGDIRIAAKAAKEIDMPVGDVTLGFETMSTRMEPHWLVNVQVPTEETDAAEPVIVVCDILVSRSKGGDARNANRWWNKGGDWMTRS